MLLGMGPKYLQRLTADDTGKESLIIVLTTVNKRVTRWFSFDNKIFFSSHITVLTCSVVAVFNAIWLNKL